MRCFKGDMQVINGHALGTNSHLLFIMPTKFVVWPSLVISQVTRSNVSLAGHTCGAAAGLLHVYVPRIGGQLTGFVP